MGLDIEPFGDGAYVVRGVPPAMAGRDTARALPELLDLLGREDGPKEEPAARVAASPASHGAGRAGQAVTGEGEPRLGLDDAGVMAQLVIGVQESLQVADDAFAVQPPEHGPPWDAGRFGFIA